MKTCSYFLTIPKLLENRCGLSEGFLCIELHKVNTGSVFRKLEFDVVPSCDESLSHKFNFNITCWLREAPPPESESVPLEPDPPLPMVLLPFPSVTVIYPGQDTTLYSYMLLALRVTE